MSTRDCSGPHTECRPVCSIGNHPRYADTIWWQLETNFKASGWGKQKKISGPHYLLAHAQDVFFSVWALIGMLYLERGWHIPVSLFWIPPYFCESMKLILLDRFKGDIFQKSSAASNSQNLWVEATSFSFFCKTLNVSCQRGERACRDKWLKSPLWCVDSNPQIAHRCQQLHVE